MWTHFWVSNRTETSCSIGKQKAASVPSYQAQDESGGSKSLFMKHAKACNRTFLFEDMRMTNENQITPGREFLTEKEASIYLKTSRQTLWRARKKQGLPFYRLYSKVLYDRRDLDSLLDRNRRSVGATA